MSESCGNCRYMERCSGITRESEGELPTDEYGSCRRYPPVFVNDRGEEMNVCSWSFPVIHEDQWCGEWRESLPSNKERE